MTQASVMPDFRYRAFISYSHQDKAWAGWLHKALETYAIPKRLVGQVTAAGVIPKRLAPVFCDRDELASATDLSRQVNQALAQSANLIVICSPRSAASRWVNDEVLAFKRLGRSEQIFCLIVAGEPNASELPGRASEECFAEALRHPIRSDGSLSDEPTEPIAADVRSGKDGKGNAKLKLIAGMLGIGFDALKRRELQRRHRRMTALAALALIVMALTTTLAIIAVIARNAAVVASENAERRQKQAEGLVNFMLGDLNDKLAQVARLDILEAVDNHAMSYFQSLPTTDVTDEALAQRAKALEKIGSVRLDQGHLPAAMTAYQAALKLAAPLAEAAPHDTARQLAYAEILAFVGMTHWRQGQLDASEQDFATAQRILQRVDPRGGNDPQLQFQLATIDNDIGHVLEARGRLDEAAIQYRNMLVLIQQVVAEQPDSAEWKARLGVAHNNLGKVALLRGDLATAVAQYAADNNIEPELAARDLQDNNQREQVAIARATLGRTLALTGDLKTGALYLQQAVDIVTQLRAVDPKNSSFQEDVALYGSQLSRLRRLDSALPAAHALTTQSLAIFLALTTQDPANADWQRELAETRLEQAEQSRTAGDADRARTQARHALRVLQPLARSQPDDRAILLATAHAQLLLAAVTDDQRISQPLRSAALTAMQGQKSGGNDPRLLALQVEALLALQRKADALPLIRKLRDRGYRDQALVSLLQHEHIDYPANPAFQQELLAATSKEVGK